MKIIGIICEYNPFHLGHLHQMEEIRRIYGEDTAIVCLMSGSFVQRGAPALFDKSRRAEAALRCGADLVLELPVPYALSSAEGFASGGVKILSGFCQALSFGAEAPDTALLMDAAHALLSPQYSQQLRAALKTGCSFASARQTALEALGIPGEFLSAPNTILGIEYCKAILRQNSPMEAAPILRKGAYHAALPDAENPSATALRHLILGGENALPYLPEPARPIFDHAPRFTWQAGERAVLARLRTMTEEEFEHLPYGSEGLWRKLMHAARQEAALQDIFSAVKSKRYAYSRISRMILCAYLGITRETLETPVPYTRVLGFTPKGRMVLKEARASGDFPNLGENIRHPYQAQEIRWESLAGLFCEDAPQPPDLQQKRRVVVLENPESSPR